MVIMKQLLAAGRRGGVETMEWAILVWAWEVFVVREAEFEGERTLIAL